MIRKGAILSVFVFILLASIVAAQVEKIEVSTTKDTFVAGESITLKVSLLDSSNNPVEGDVKVILEDAQKTIQVEKVIPSNKVTDISLGEGAPAGYWKITSSYDSLTSTSLFLIETSDLVKFELSDNVLTVINVGNTRYTNPIQIVIGETIGTKEVDLGVGERVSFRLVAPEGVYNLKVTDGKTTLTQGGVSLTGNVIGVLDNRQLSSSPLTSGLQGGEPAAYGEDSVAPRNNTLVYLFIFVVFGAAILMVIERRFRKSAFQSSNFQLTNKSQLTN